MRDAAPDPAVLWSSMQRLLARLVEPGDRGGFLDECLDTLVEIVGADRGLVLLLHDDGGASAIHARSGKGRPLDPFEREEISKSAVARVRATGRCVVFRPMEDASATESMHVLGIASAIAAPIRKLGFRANGEGDGLRGVVYLDVRDRRRALGEEARAFVEAAAHVMSVVLEPAEELASVREDLRALGARRLEDGPGLEELLRPESMRAVHREVATSIAGDAPILVLGESGTGKTQLARAIAEASGKTPIVRATLGSSDDLNTITSELFGHEKGSFSGALAKRTGLVEFADGGTLIFDEILNLPPQAQQLLLDFTQFGTFRPLGYDKREPKRARVRLIAATNGDLDAAIRAGRFRQDLYYRLARVTLVLPSLRERREDVPMLAEGILRRSDPARSWRLSVPLRRLLMSEDLGWPGNVRQLEAVIGRARDRAVGRDPNAEVLGPEHVEPRDLGCATLSIPAPRAVHDRSSPLCAAFQIEEQELGDSFARLVRERETLEQLERTIVSAALERHGGVIAYAARELGVPRTSLASRLQTLGIERPKRRG